MTDFELKAAEQSAIVLGNAAELVSQVIISFAGNDVSNRIFGSPLTLNALRSLALASFQNELGIKTV